LTSSLNSLRLSQFGRSRHSGYLGFALPDVVGHRLATDAERDGVNKVLHLALQALALGREMRGVVGLALVDEGGTPALLTYWRAASPVAVAVSTVTGL